MNRDATTHIRSPSTKGLMTLLADATHPYVTGDAPFHMYLLYLGFLSIDLFTAIYGSAL